MDSTMYTHALKRIKKVDDKVENFNERNGFVNVKDFGLVGDRVTDNYLEFSDLLTEIAEREASILIADGVYSIGSDITIPSNIELIFNNTGVLKTINSATITLNCKIVSGLHQIFEGEDEYSWTGSPQVSLLYPEWFGGINELLLTRRIAFLTCKKIAEISNLKINISSDYYLSISRRELVDSLLGLDVNEDNISDGYNVAGNATIFEYSANKTEGQRVSISDTPAQYTNKGVNKFFDVEENQQIYSYVDYRVVSASTDGRAQLNIRFYDSLGDTISTLFYTLEAGISDEYKVHQKYQLSPVGTKSMRISLLAEDKTVGGGGNVSVWFKNLSITIPSESILGDYYTGKGNLYNYDILPPLQKYQGIVKIDGGYVETPCNDQSQINEAPIVVSTSSFSRYPYITDLGINFPAEFDDVLAWGQFYEAEEESTSTNTRVKISDLDMWLLYKSSQKWVKIQEGNSFYGSYFDYSNNENFPTDIISEEDGISVKPDPQYRIRPFHFFHTLKTPIENHEDIEAIFTQCKANLIVENMELSDDRDNCKILLNVGADSHGTAIEGVPAIPPVYQGRFKYVTKEPRYFWATTQTQEEFEKNPPPTFNTNIDPLHEIIRSKPTEITDGNYKYLMLATIRIPVNSCITTKISCIQMNKNQTLPLNYSEVITHISQGDNSDNDPTAYIQCVSRNGMYSMDGRDFFFSKRTTTYYELWCRSRLSDTQYTFDILVEKTNNMRLYIAKYENWTTDLPPTWRGRGDFFYSRNIRRTLSTGSGSGVTRYICIAEFSMKVIYGSYKSIFKINEVESLSQSTCGEFQISVRQGTMGTDPTINIYRMDKNDLPLIYLLAEKVLVDQTSSNYKIWVQVNSSHFRTLSIEHTLITMQEKSDIIDGNYIWQTDALVGDITNTTELFV